MQHIFYQLAKARMQECVNDANFVFNCIKIMLKRCGALYQQLKNNTSFICAF